MRYPKIIDELNGGKITVVQLVLTIHNTIEFVKQYVKIIKCNISDYSNMHSVFVKGRRMKSFNSNEKERIVENCEALKISDYRKCLFNILIDYGFERVDNRMRFLSYDIVIVIELQKSSFTDGFYINCGFYVPSAHDESATPKAVKDCDVNIRFMHKNVTEIDKTLFDINTTGIDAFSKIVRYHMDEMLVPIINTGIQVLFEMEPTAIYCAKKKLREYLDNKMI